MSLCVCVLGCVLVRECMVCAHVSVCLYGMSHYVCTFLPLCVCSSVCSCVCVCVCYFNSLASQALLRCVPLNGAIQASPRSAQWAKDPKQGAVA